MRGIRTAKQHPTDSYTLVLTGTPLGVDPYSNEYTDCIGGFVVSRRVTDALHDGKPAVRFTLCDDTGDREIGRLVLRSDLDFREEELQWERTFHEVEDAVTFRELVNLPPEKLTYYSCEQDLAYDENTAEEAIARISAQYGVSITVTIPHGPGGGWPVVRILGTPEKLYTALSECWGMTDCELRDTEPELMNALGK